MTTGFDLPECPPSLLSRMDPRWKLAAVLLASVACTLLRSATPAVLALGGALLLVVVARLPARWYVRRLTTAMVLFAVLLIWLPFVVEEGHDVLDLGWLQISLTGSGRLLRLTAGLSALLTLILVLLATTPISSICKAAGALYFPRLLVLLILLTYRYAFLLLEEFSRLRIALRVRGFRNRANLHSYRTIGQVAGTLLVRSHERSERVAQAMAARGFDGTYRTLQDFATKPADVLVFLSIVGYAFVLVGWDSFT
jgi:cobalt/nickel transport system permease protein